jgi:Uma2 family endonuclease
MRIENPTVGQFTRDADMSTTQAPVTEEQLLRLPDDGRKYELVDGAAKEVPTGIRQGEIGAIIIYRLTPHIIGRGFLTMSQAGFRMRGGNLRCPDVSFTRKERFPKKQAPEGFGDAAPDLAIEIISPSEDDADVFRKLDEYFASGSEQVWLVEPDTQRVTVYRSLMNPQTYDAGEEITAGDLLPGFRCRVADLFTLE